MAAVHNNYITLQLPNLTRAPQKTYPVCTMSTVSVSIAIVFRSYCMQLHVGVLHLLVLHITALRVDMQGMAYTVIQFSTTWPPPVPLIECFKISFYE